MSHLRPHPLAPTWCFPAQQPGPHLVPRPWCRCCCSHLPGVSCSYQPSSPDWGCTVEDPALDSQGSQAQTALCSIHPPTWGREVGLWFQKHRKPLHLLGLQSPTGHHPCLFYQVVPLCPPDVCLPSVSQIPAVSLATLCSKRGQRGSRLERPRREAQGKEPSVNWADC